MSGALIFLFVLSVLIIVHEYGHFLAARACGVNVEKFSIGFGPVVFGRRFGPTEFVVSLLPLGGFVKMAGESPGEAKGMPWEFQSRPPFQKTLIVAAGPAMNAALAFVLFAFVFMTGQPTLSARVGAVLADGPAAAAGIREDDRVLAVDGRAVTDWEGILQVIRSSEGRSLRMRLERVGAPVEIDVTPQVRPGRDLLGRTRNLSFIGIAPSSEMLYVKSGFFKALGLAAERVWKLTALIFTSLGLMITGALPFKDSVTGPIGIFFMTKQAAVLGAAYLFYFMGSLSVSLFVLNLLPIPVLDGGHLLFILIERVKGSPLKESVKERMTQAGLIALLALMGWVIFQDIVRYAVFENLWRGIGQWLGK